MKSSHLDYLVDMILSVQKDGVSIFTREQILEVEPSMDTLQNSIPCVVIKHSPILTQRSEKSARRLPSVLREGTTFFRYLTQLVKQEFRYTVEFWIEDPSHDLDTSEDDPGILDQCFIYLDYRRRFNRSEGVQVEVYPIRSMIVDDPAKEQKAYKLLLELKMKDGIYTVREEESLAGSELEVEGSSIELQDAIESQE